MINGTNLVSSSLVCTINNSCSGNNENKIKIKKAEDFNKSGDINSFFITAREVAKKLKELNSLDFRLSDVALPFNLTAGHVACLAQDINLLNIFLEEQPNLKEQCTEIKHVSDLYIEINSSKIPAMNGDSPLHIALFINWKIGAEVLIASLSRDKKLNNSCNGTGNSLFHLACAHSELSVVESLNNVIDDLDVKATTEPGKSTPLHSAVRFGKPDVVEWLLKNDKFNGCISLKDAGGKTPYDHLNDRLKNMERAVRLVSPEKMINEVMEWRDLSEKLNGLC